MRRMTSSSPSVEACSQTPSTRCCQSFTVCSSSRRRTGPGAWPDPVSRWCADYSGVGLLGGALCEPASSAPRRARPRLLRRSSAISAGDSASAAASVDSASSATADEPGEVDGLAVRVDDLRPCRARRRAPCCGRPRRPWPAAGCSAAAPRRTPGAPCRTGRRDCTRYWVSSSWQTCTFSALGDGVEQRSACGTASRSPR